MNNNKLVFGLLAVLFISSFGNTLGILNLSKGRLSFAAPAGDTQKAQVLLSSCVQATPLYTVNDFVVDHTAYPTVNQSMTDIMFNVKNNCSTGIKIIDAHSLNPQGTTALGTTSIQRKNFNNDPETIDPVTNAYGIHPNTEKTVCIDCNGGVPSYHASPAATYFYQLLNTYAVADYSIPAGATRKVIMRVGIPLPELTTEVVRVVPLRIKWFNDSALSDNSVSANEIKTFTFTNPNNYASDYFHLADQN